MTVRAGQGNRSIEIVIEGKGAAVSARQAVPLPRAPTPAATPGTAAASAVIPATLARGRPPFRDRAAVIQRPQRHLRPLVAARPAELRPVHRTTRDRWRDALRSPPRPLHDTPAGRSGVAATVRIPAGHGRGGGAGASPEHGRSGATGRPPVPTPVPGIRCLFRYPFLSPLHLGPHPSRRRLPAPGCAVPEPPPRAAAPQHCARPRRLHHRCPPPVTPPSAATAPPATPESPPSLTPPEIEARASTLLASAQTAMAQGNHAAAVEALNELLNLPPSAKTREAQELIGIARARSGDLARARIEFQTYLQLYPQGEGTERVRHQLLALPAAPPPVPTRPKSPTETTVTGSTSLYYYGGNGQVRSQDFKDSPIAGLPQVPGDPQFTSDKTRQIIGDVDLTWRQRSADTRHALRGARLVHRRPRAPRQEQEPPDEPVRRLQVADRRLRSAARAPITDGQRHHGPLRWRRRQLPDAPEDQVRCRGRHTDRSAVRFQAAVLRRVDRRRQHRARTSAPGCT